jgi:hypothetical protein
MFFFNSEEWLSFRKFMHKIGSADRVKQGNKNGFWQGENTVF